MMCPFCSNEDSKVIDKRDTDTSTRRRRECLGCHQRFTTYERVEVVELQIAKKDGRRETFNPEKLRGGILLACQKRPVTQRNVDQILERVETELRSARTREVPSSKIGEIVMRELKALDQVAYIRFASVYQSFTDVTSFQTELNKLRGEISQ